MGWDFKSPGVLSDVARAIDGYVVYVMPDPMASQGRKPGDWQRFELPKWVKESYPVGGTTQFAYHEVDGLWLGGLDWQKEVPLGSSSLVSVKGEYIEPSYAGPELRAIGDLYVDSQLKEFIKFVSGLPLAPGFTHKLKVAAYNGVPGSPDFREGPLSDPLELSGDTAACDSLATLSGPGADELKQKIIEFYECRGQVDLAPVVTDDFPFRSVGVVGDRHLRGHLLIDAGGVYLG